MPSNQDKIYNQYGDGTGEDGRATQSRSSGIEFHYTKKHISQYINKETSVIELGCATGYYGLYFADKCKEYLGIDLFPPHIDIFKQKIVENKLTNVSAQVGDATNLSKISDNSFDVVLCFGPMYHLPPKEREFAFAECRRICKDGGIIAFAYINKVGVYAGACVHDKYREYYPNAKTNEYVLNLGTDDEKPDLFYFTMPEEIELVAKSYGLTKIKNLGADFFITMSIIDAMSEEKFHLYMALADQMASYESCTGMSNHALLICRKGEY